MKKTACFGLIISLIMVAACMPDVQDYVGVFLPTETVAFEESTLAVTETYLSEQALQNMSYLSPTFGTELKLKNGVYADERMMVTLLSEIAFGDINGDQINDAAVLLAESGGGTGNVVSLLALVGRDDQFEQVGSILIDDRPVIESLLIEDGSIKLSAVIHGVNDPMVSPSQKVNLTFILFESNLMVMKQTLTMPGGSERNIVINSPQSGNEVSGPVRITGSMPAAPFENNLRLRILDLTGMELFVSGFVVTSEDVGEPAIFESEITLPDLPIGRWVKLELADISMADGSVICMDSTLVKVK